MHDLASFTSNGPTSLALPLDAACSNPDKMWIGCHVRILPYQILLVRFNWVLGDERALVEDIGRRSDRNEPLKSVHPPSRSAHPRKADLDAMAVTAISTDLLRSCIQVDWGSSEKFEERKRTMSLKSVKSLVFSFKGLRAIDFLVGLESLTKLYLDNNNISKIENISHLPTLTLLDLSFNKIQKIEGLEALTNLEDLSLYNNQIEKTSGLETLQNLNSLSLGKNFLKSLDSVLSLRRLKCLRVLTLEGNPISKDPEYRNYVIAHVEDLKYLDHRFVDTSCVTAAREQYQDEMLEIKHKEAEEEVMIKVATEKAREQEAFKEANLVGVDTMFDVMLDEDPEYHKLKEIPGLLNSLQEYRQKYFTATEELKSIMLSQLAKKMEEVKSWSAAVTILLDERDKKAREMTIQLKKLNKEGNRSQLRQ
ncbi:hypothetical protein O6H91_11G017600 [Diphasiastrum complanatum]|uniref:Uncharacterized protein n=1 Tax=Diphasiastrum complanatum TaxID=34168 RepID=A0ACC2C6Q2_DIPCM|nr:hypothetical protein O6H91_11G017600 [Diphasiastrum complanatum]